MSENLGMFTIPLEDLAERLADYQHSVCAYGTRDGDGRTCDCKYGAVTLYGNKASLTEQTGCPELRMATRLVRRLVAKEDLPKTPVKYEVHVYADGEFSDDALVEVETSDACLAVAEAVKRVIAGISVAEIRRTA